MSISHHMKPYIILNSFFAERIAMTASRYQELYFLSKGQIGCTGFREDAWEGTPNWKQKKRGVALSLSLPLHTSTLMSSGTAGYNSTYTSTAKHNS